MKSNLEEQKETIKKELHSQRETVKQVVRRMFSITEDAAANDLTLVN